MITELGHFALILALCVSLTQSLVPLIGAARGNLAWMAVGRNAHWCSSRWSRWRWRR